VSAAQSGTPAGSAPLAGLRVLDLSELLPGLYATSPLADPGAEVLKVERPPRTSLLHPSTTSTKCWPTRTNGPAAWWTRSKASRLRCPVPLRDLPAQRGKAPALGEHTQAILAELGLPADALRAPAEDPHQTRESSRSCHPGDPNP
jgi:crotonobetainyl-CoA:carnitine CoA-transferase CaiB-like acyl-CoA transferase